MTQTGWAGRNMCMCALPLTTPLCVAPQTVCDYFILLINHVPIMACHHNYLFFFGGLAIDCEN